MTYHKGVQAEEHARCYLESLGFKTLARRLRTPYGEIDLLMQEGKTLVAVEVKFRKNQDDCHYCLTPKQQARIQDALLYYVRGLDQDSTLLRCDVVLLSPHKDIIHYKNAW